MLSDVDLSVFHHIQATDPVSTLVLFAELRVEPHLFYLVFGESVMNDAVGLVLFDNAREFITNPGFSKEIILRAVRQRECIICTP